jgi:hypothetical protein
MQKLSMTAQAMLTTCIKKYQVEILSGTPTILTDILLFSSVPSGKCLDSASNYAMTISFHILSISLLTIILIFYAIQSELQATSFNKT